MGAAWRNWQGRPRAGGTVRHREVALTTSSAGPARRLWARTPRRSCAVCLGVEKVTRSGPERRPSARIVHLCDYHFVPPEPQGLELDSVAYRLQLARVEQVHHKHLAVLRCLIRCHGMQAVHAEGLNDDGRRAWRERVALLREMLADEPVLLAARQAGKLAADADAILEQVRLQRLEAGPAGVVEALGEGRAIPLEAKEGGEVADRDRAIVKRLLAAGPLAVVVLGGGHDLAGEAARQGRRVQYLRVETTRYPPP